MGKPPVTDDFIHGDLLTVGNTAGDWQLNSLRLVDSWDKPRLTDWQLNAGQQLKDTVGDWPTVGSNAGD